MTVPDLLDRTSLTRLLEPLGIDVLGTPEPIGTDHGFASSRAAVPVAVRGGPPVSVVVKVWPSVEHGLGEIEFYGEWTARLPIRLPACHGMAATDDYGVLVLEDLRPFRQGNELEPLSRTDAIAVAETIARVHRSTTGLDSDLPPPRFGRPLPPEWHDSRRVAYRERFGMPDDDLVRAVVVHSEAAWQIAASLLIDAPVGLTHSDLHLDNLVFLDDEPVVLDWARPGWGPAAHDLATLLVSGIALPDFESVIAAHRRIAATDDDQVDGAVLMRLVVATLGTALWQPNTPRQERLVVNGRRRVTEVAGWLAERRPGLLGLLRG